MPRIPYTGVPDREPSNIPIESGATPQAFGVNVGQAISRLGETGNQVGNELFARAVALQELNLESKTYVSAEDAMVKNANATNEFRQKQGDYPQAHLDEHIAQLRANVDAPRNGMSPYEANLYNKLTLRRLGYDITSAADYAASEAKKYHTATALSFSDQITNNMVAHANDPNASDIINHGLSQQKDLEINTALGEGITGDNPQLQARIQKRMMDSIGKIAESFAKSDPDKGYAFLDAHAKDIGGKDTVGYLIIKDKLDTQAVRVDSARDARSITGGPGTAISPDVAAAVNKIATDKGWTGGTFTPENISRLVQQESAWKNVPPNKYGYGGFFAMKPSEFGLPKDAFSHMTFEQQLDLYTNSYLPKYGYTGKEDLGVMNAAPAFKNASDDTIAYPAGSKEAMANPAWVRSSNANGAVTVGGIKNWAQAAATGRVDLSQVYDQARTIITQRSTSDRYANNPALTEQYTEQLMRNINSNVNIQRKEFTDQVNQYGIALQSALLRPGPNGDRPRTIEEAAAVYPNFEKDLSTLRTLDPVRAKHVDDQISANAKMEVNLTPARRARFQELSAMAALQPDEFSKVSIGAEDLPQSGPYSRDKLYEMKTKIDKKTQDSSKLFSALHILTPMLNDAGIVSSRSDTSKAAAYNQFTGALQERLAEFEQEKKRFPNEQEVMTMGADLLRTTTNNWFFADTRAFEVPSEQATSITSTFKSRYGRDPNPAEISIIYQRMLKNAPAQQ